MDVYDKTTRSSVMRSVKSKNTGAEMVVRRLLHAAGFRYRLHRKDLPGKPDIVFPGRRKVIFVHGCFWHQHPNCHFADRPASNVNYWNTKLDRNVTRDTQNIAALKEQGWNVYVVWECKVRDTSQLLEALREFLNFPAENDCNDP